MSNTIYSAILPVISQDKNKFNFVYQITEISTGMKYIGSHGTKKADPLKALKKYKSTTKDKCFKLNQELNPLNYHYEILSYHSTRDEATLEESRLHFLYDVKTNPKYYNKSNQTANGFSTAGKVVTKDECGNIHFVSCDDPRYLSGELISISHGMIVAKDIYNNCYQVSIDDPRYLSGELVDPVTLFAQGFTCLRARVVKLTRLTDNNRARTQNQDTFYICTFWHGSFTPDYLAVLRYCSINSIKWSNNGAASCGPGLASG